MAGNGSIIADVREQVIAKAGEAPTVGGLFAAASQRLRRLVAFDAAVWLASDPATGMPTAPTRTEGLTGFGVDACMRAWELEFMVEDVNLYSALARRDAPAGGLRLATGDRPGRSARYRDVLRPNGFGDELRAVLRADGSPWALLSLFRATGSAPFDAHDSGLMLFASSGELVSVNDDARAWLGELAGDGASATSSTCRSRSRSSAR